MTIRQADITHLNTLCDFQQAMALESEGLELNSDTLRNGIGAILNDTGKGIYYIAEQDNKPVGCLMITYEWSDWRNCWTWWIQSVYVSKTMRRKGVFNALYSHIKTLAIQSGVKVIRLYADRNNHVAHKAYRRVGMSDEHYITFEWSDK